MKVAVDSSVVHQVRLRDAVSRIDLARLLQIAPSTIGIHVDRLVSGGFLREGKRAQSGLGRPRTLLELNPEAGQFIGVDLDAREIRSINVDFAQQTLGQQADSIPTDSKASDVIDLIGTMIDRVRRGDRRLLGIGLAVPGMVDVVAGKVGHYRLIANWHDVPLVEKIGGQFDVPVYLENNIRAMAMAERWFGLGRDVDDYLCIGIRSGIGSGLVLGGELHRGSTNLAGEIGTWPLVQSETGETKTLEEQASIPALLDQASLVTRPSMATDAVESLSLDEFIQRAQEGDADVLQILSRAAEGLARVIAQVQLMVNPQRVIIAGPLAILNDSLIQVIRKDLVRLLPQWKSVLPTVVGSELASMAGALGAAACAVHAWQPATPD